jgi:uncharacterized protein (DUF1501 family)
MHRIDRRELLGMGLALGGLTLFPRALRAEPRPAAALRRTVVLLHLVGGNDGLNTLVPHGERRYRALRPTLALERSSLVPLTDGLGLHPALRPLEALLAQERLAVVAGVGYPEPDFSHFRATEIWQTAQPDRPPRFGWVGRALAQRPRSAPLRALAIAREQPLALHAPEPSVATLTDFARFRLPPGLEEIASLYAPGGAGAAGASPPDMVDQVAAVGERALSFAARIASLRPADGPFQGGLGDDLRKALALLTADLDLEALHLGFGGFDTHAAQARPHGELLGQLAQNLVAWQGELVRRRLDARVVTLVYSEFGRRAEENASAGTDHGSAGPVLVLGTGLHGGLHGAQPALDDLEDGNLRYSTDFRRVYAALMLNAWGQDPRAVLGEFAPLELFR